mmetsp:Transcript_33603/g.101436  ORF Transcript_33603/g.101436 Transcript_33603/m.101436 type:complete len:486 (+) Transcript_33603:151-1608(+)
MQMCTRTVLFLAILPAIDAHGFMVNPPSRMYEVYSTFNGGAGPGEYNLNGIAAKDMVSSPRFPDRGYPGRNPWAEPGSSIECYGENRQNCGGNSVAYNTYPINTELGVCGTSIDNDRINYNTPSPSGVFGQAPTDDQTDRIYAPGEVIDVAWCVSADHGGIPMFRLCDDPSKVEAVTTPGYDPSLRELEDLEECFQEGLLRCDAVDENLPNCELVSACDGNDDWAACKFGKYIHCNEDRGDGSQWDYSCKNTDDVEDTCGDYGTLAEYKLRIPENFPASAHTILSFRWDTFENNEVFVGCADIAIVRDGDPGPSSTPPPVAKPTTPPSKPPTSVPSKQPTSPPTTPTAPSSSSSKCCGWTDSGDPCSCYYAYPSDDWCNENADQCGRCTEETGGGAGWCSSGIASDATPTSNPSYQPSYNPTSRPVATPATAQSSPCCAWSSSDDPCSCDSPYPADNWCAQTAERCEGCAVGSGSVAGAGWCRQP